MKAALLFGPGDLRVVERPVPRVRPGTALLRVDACCICGSDLRIVQHGERRIEGPRILGHEIAGTIVAVGEGVTSLAPGDRVATGADLPCGRCPFCEGGRPNNCAANLAMGYQFDGGFAEYVLLEREAIAGPVGTFPPGFPAAEAALAELLACGLHAWSRVGEGSGLDVVVFGAGPAGQVLAMLARLREGAGRVFVFEPRDGRRASALRWADEAHDPFAVDPVEVVMDATSGRGADRVFCACADPSTHEQAVRMLATRGVVNLFGGLAPGTPPPLLHSNALHYREGTVTASHGSTPSDFAQALRLVLDGGIPAGALLTHEVPLDAIHEGLDLARSGAATKVVVRP